MQSAKYALTVALSKARPEELNESPGLIKHVTEDQLTSKEAFSQGSEEDEPVPSRDVVVEPEHYRVIVMIIIETERASLMLSYRRQPLRPNLRWC